jgi:hypothetical protein
MHAAVRPHAAAGVAVLAASALAVSPLTPPMPDVQATVQRAVSSAAVNLTALENPLTVFADLLGEQLGNAGALAGSVIANPAPILGEIGTNQIGSAVALANILSEVTTAVAQSLATAPQQVQAAISDLQAGQITDALNSLIGIPLGAIVGPLIGTTALTDLQAVIRQPVANLLKVIDAAPQALLLVTAPDGTPEAGVGLAAVGVLQSLVNAVGNGTQDFVAAVQSGNPENVANAVTNGLAGITKASLDGLFAPNDPTLATTPGIITGLLNTRDGIAQALAAPTDAALAAKSTTFTLKAVAPKALDASAPKTESDATAKDSTTKDVSSTKSDTDTKDAAGTGDTATKPVKADKGGRHRAQADNPMSSAVKKFRDSVKKASGDSKHAKADTASSKSSK